MKRFLLLLVGSVLLPGCSSGPRMESGPLARNAPSSFAVLTETGGSDRRVEAVRAVVLQALREKGYAVLPVRETDRLLARAEEEAELGVDAVARLSVRPATERLEMDLRLEDVRTGDRLWRLEGAFSVSDWRERLGLLLQEDLPDAKRVRRPRPSFSEVEVRFEGRGSPRPGDRFRLRVRGTPRRRVFFRLGDSVLVPLPERAPGRYEATWPLPYGLSGPFHARFEIRDRYERETRRRVEIPWELDTRAPGPPAGLAVRRGPSGRRHLAWSSSGEDAVRYLVLGLGRNGAYDVLLETEATRADLSSLSRVVRRVRVVAVDRRGNASRPSPVFALDRE